MFNKPTLGADLLSKSPCSASDLNVTKFKNVKHMIWVTLFMLPKMFNKATSEAGLFSKSSCLVPAQDVTKFTNFREMILVTLGCAT
jgi:hypothetical protein